MISRRSAIKSAAAVAFAAHAGTRDAISAAPAASPDRPFTGESFAQAKEPEMLTHVGPTTVEPPKSYEPCLYGPDHPLAQGETLMIPAAAEKPLFGVEEISRRVAPLGEYLFATDGMGAEDLLRNRLDEEVDRYCAVAWGAYKQELRKVETLLRDAGVDQETMHGAIGHLDEAAVNLFTEGHCSMLEVGLDAGKKIAHDYRTSLIFMPGSETCPTCLGSGGLDSPCRTCGGSCLVEPGPGLVMIYIPDGVADAEAETEDVVAAA